MRKCNFLFIIILISLFGKTYGQWNKLPTQNLITYWPWVPWSGAWTTKIFPAFSMPVGNGHILIAAFYDNGSVSANSSYYEVFESFDDLSSNTSLNAASKIVSLYAGNFNFPYGGIKSPIYCKKDSSLSWVEHAKYTNLYKNKYTKNGFQTIDSTDYCHPTGPSNVVTNGLTTNFLYSVHQSGYLTTTDSLAFGRSSLTGSSIYCKKVGKYDGTCGVLKPVNDSVVLFSCVNKTDAAKKNLLRTIDYGQTWNEVYGDSLNSILDYTFTSNDIGYVLLSNNTVLKTTNGGSSWVTLATTTSTITCLSFFNDNIGYMGGVQGFLSKTTDGGQTWNNEISGTSHQLKEIFTLANNVAYFRDSISDLYKNTPVLISVKENKKNNTVLNVFPNPTTNNITIQTNDQKLGSITIYNVFGEVIFELFVKENKALIDVSSFSSGIYILKNKNSSTRIIKN